MPGQTDPLIGKDAGHRGLRLHHLVERLDLLDIGRFHSIILMLSTVDLPRRESDEAGDENENEQQGPQPFGGQRQAEQIKPPIQADRARR
ncbi:hypothetical protein BAU01nite_35710 [Brevibacterium aurantiacum]|nr:hypothetical protein BAU01nite_35710 [Brevibacterium aurantiacum]